MARKFFEKQGIRRRGGPLASGVTFVVYTDVAGTVLADISATSGGSAIAGAEITTADIAGLGPAAFRFYGPTDGTDTLYLRCPADPSLGVQEIEADEDERLDALEAGGGGGAHPNLATHDSLGLATDAELTAHGADTTVVHGIADTTKIIVREDLTQAVIDAKQAAGGALRLGVGTHTVSSAITLRGGVPLIGDSYDPGSSKGTLIQGTSGQDVFLLPGDVTPGVDYSGYSLENLTISGGRNQLRATNIASTYVAVRDVQFSGAEESAVLVDGTSAIEEWYFDNVVFQGGQYGFRKISGGDADVDNNYIDKSVFKDCLFGGQTKSGVHVDGTIFNTITFINPIFNLIAEHAFYWRGGLRSMTLINANTEQCGTSGKNNRTTLSGTVSSGATSGTLASATGWATGDQITIMGAGAGALDFYDTVTISGTTATWSTPTSTTVANPQVTNAKWDEFHFETIPAFATPANITFVGGILASEASLGRLRYSIYMPGSNCVFLGTAGTTVPAYLGTRRFTALGGDLAVRSLGREFNTSTSEVGGALTALAAAANEVPMRVGAFPSQSAHLQDWADSAGNVMTFIDQLGRLYMGASQALQFDSTNRQIIIDASSGSAGADRLDIKLAPSETRRALRVLNSAGTELFTIGPDGLIYFGDPTSAVSIRKGTGTPEAAVTAPVGSLFLRTDGGASTSLYVKQSGAGNTGWAAGAGAVTTTGGGKETVQAHGAMGATETFDLANGNIHTGTLDANCTFTFTGTTASVACSMTLILTQDGTGSRLVTWPASVDWPGGVAPALSTGINKVDMLTFVTVDNGTTWQGLLSGLDLR